MKFPNMIVLQIIMTSIMMKNQNDDVKGYIDGDDEEEDNDDGGTKK